MDDKTERMTALIEDTLREHAQPLQEYGNIALPRKDLEHIPQRDGTYTWRLVYWRFLGSGVIDIEYSPEDDTFTFNRKRDVRTTSDMQEVAEYLVERLEGIREGRVENLRTQAKQCAHLSPETALGRLKELTKDVFCGPSEGEMDLFKEFHREEREERQRPTIGWGQYHSDIRTLAEKVSALYTPDIIVPCMLGGLIPGAIMAKELGVQDVRPIDIEREDDERRLAYDVQGDVKGKKVLIVEDDIPTGKTPLLVKQIFEERDAEVRIAALYVTQDTKKTVDFYAEVRELLPHHPWKRFNRGNRLRT